MADKSTLQVDIARIGGLGAKVNGKFSSTIQQEIADVVKRLKVELGYADINTLSLTPRQRGDITARYEKECLDADNAKFNSFTLPEAAEAPTLPEAVPTPAEVPTSSVQAQITTKKGKLVNAIIKEGKATPARGKSEVERGRQALSHRSALTVSKGKVVNIYLESEFDTAADLVTKITGESKSEWFKKVILSAEVMNPTAALRIDIVSKLTELLEATQ